MADNLTTDDIVRVRDLEEETRVTIGGGVVFLVDNDGYDTDPPKKVSDEVLGTFIQSLAPDIIRCGSTVLNAGVIKAITFDKALPTACLVFGFAFAGTIPDGSLVISDETTTGFSAITDNDTTLKWFAIAKTD